MFTRAAVFLITLLLAGVGSPNQALPAATAIDPPPPLCNGAALKACDRATTSSLKAAAAPWAALVWASTAAFLCVYSSQEWGAFGIIQYASR